MRPTHITRMRRRSLGPTGVKVPVIGQGTWAMETGDPRAAVRAIRRGLDLGMTHIDTAEMYGSGAVEEIVGKAIRGRRDEVFLVSKVAPEHAGHRSTIAACEASLARLATDRLDLYLLHWRRPSTPLEATFRAFEDLLESGKIRAFGVSNFDVPDLEEALAIVGSGKRGAPGRIACDQVLYHLGERAIERAVIPWCEAHGVAVVAYSPFGSGHFVDPGSPGGRVLAEVARAHAATPRQVALAFLTRRKSLFAIPKAATEEHVVENAAAGALRLRPADVRRLEAAFPLGPPGPLPIL